MLEAKPSRVSLATLAKLLLWTLGCEPHLDVNWTSTETRCILEFIVDGRQYTVGRNDNFMVFSEAGGPPEAFPKITGPYARRLAAVLGFDVLLPNRKEATQLEVPPPAYYFLPFYVDQRRGWASAWSGFNGLEQYASWHAPVISYHTGYLKPEHFQYAEKIAAEGAAAKVDTKNIERITSAISVVEELAPAVRSPSAGEKVDDLIEDIGQNVAELHRNIDSSLAALTLNREQLAQLSAQREMLRAAADDLGLDYTFAVENTSGDRLLCPICGTEHNNTLAERAGLLAEKAAAEGDLKRIDEKYAQIALRTQRIEKKVRLLRQTMQSYSSRFVSEPPTDDKKDFLSRLSSAAIQTMATKTRAEAEVRLAHRKGEEKRLKKEQRALLSKDERLALNVRFRTLLVTYVDRLGASGVNLSGVDTPMNHKRLFGSGGAAESARAVLAYYLAVLTMIQEADNEVLAPIIVDTPNQQEQTDLNYESALRTIVEKTSSAQLFVCAMDRDAVQPYKERGLVIWLDPGERLLDQRKFAELWPMFERFFPVQDGSAMVS